MFLCTYQLPLCSLILCVRFLLVSPRGFSKFLTTQTIKFINDVGDESSRNAVFKFKEKGNSKVISEDEIEFSVKVLCFKYDT